MTLADGKRVTIIAKNGKWYHVKFKLARKTFKGYLHSSYVKVQTGKVRTSICGKVLVSGQQLHTKANENSSMTKVDGNVVKMVKGTAVKILSEKYIITRNGIISPLSREMPSVRVMYSRFM